MLVFQYNVLSVLLFVVILNCGTGSEIGGIRGGWSRVGVSGGGGGVSGYVLVKGGANFAYHINKRSWR